MSIQRDLSRTAVVAIGLAFGSAFAQQQTVERTDNPPVFRVDVVSRSIPAINYQHRSGATKINFQGTSLSPKANGEAKVESKKGYIEIEVEFDELQRPNALGQEYLTYVLWAITPEGRAQNLGELLVDGNRGKLNVTTDLQVFGLIITAEPYFSVTSPSDAVILENVVRSDTRGKAESIVAKYELLQRGQYTRNVRPESLAAFVPNGKVPLELVEARNAINIARGAGADKWAADTFEKAVSRLKQSEDYFNRNQKKPTVMVAREAVQTAEDARLITVRRIEEDRLAKEREAAAQREAAAKAKADQEAVRREQAEQQRLIAEQQKQAADTQRLEAERQRQAALEQQQMAEQQRQAALQQQRQAEQERLAAEKAKAEADAARQAALEAQRAAQSEAEKARQAADEANRLRAQSEDEKKQLREQLLQQLNAVLQTRATARGLIVNMSDVLFDTARYTLRPGAREKLAKIAGIVASHPGLKLEVEGHTDSVGADDYNQTLSEKRAQSVRDYLVQQGIAPADITSRGFGETMPVASNDNAAGRQQNRRVELVVSGQPMGIESNQLSPSQR